MASTILGVTLVLCLAGWVLASHLGARGIDKDNKHPFWRRGEYFSTNLDEEDPEEPEEG